MSVYAFSAYVAAGAGRLARRSVSGHAPRAGDRRLHHRGAATSCSRSRRCRRSSSASALVAIGTGLFKVERVDDGRAALPAGRPAPRRRLHHLLHGRQRGRVLRADRVRLLRGRARAGAGTGASARRASGCCSGSAPTSRSGRKYLAGIGEAPNRAHRRRASRRSRAPLTREERDRLIALLVVFAFTIMFWMAFEQAASSMNFFAAGPHRPDRVRASRFPRPGSSRSIRSCLMLAAPLFAALWTCARAPRPRAEHAGQDGGGAGADGDRLRVHGVRRAPRSEAARW